MPESCGYCGRFMSYVEHGDGWGGDWVCSQQARHILDDPDHWTTFPADANS